MDPRAMEPDAGARARALELLMQQGQQPQPEPSLWDRLKALFGAEGRPWAENANAMLPESLSAREAVMRKRRESAMMDAMNRGD